MPNLENDIVDMPRVNHQMDITASQGTLRTPTYVNTLKN